MKYSRWMVGALMAAPMVLGGSQVALADGPGAAPAGWSERTLFERSVPVTVNIPSRDLLVVDGKTRAADPRYYDFDITAAGRALPTVSLFAASALQGPVHISLLNIPQITTAAMVKAFYRYDPNAPICLVGMGGSCTARFPFDPTGRAWVNSQSSQAELVIEVRVDLNGSAAADQFVRVPLVGQVLGGTL